MDKIACPQCARQCIPKLWHYQPMPGMLRHMATQHICPFCGDVMYETGGRMNILGWMVAIAAAGIMLVGIAAELEKSGGIGRAAGIGASLLFWGYIAYRFFSRKRR